MTSAMLPVPGLLTWFCPMTQLGIANWTRFMIWPVRGLAIYFCRGRKSSKRNGVTN